MKKYVPLVISISILLLVGTTVYINIAKQRAVDRSKLPEKVELSKGFQKWITNLKNKDFEIEADEFKLLEENEIYNTKWIKIYSLDEEGRVAELNATIDAAKNQKKTVFAPSNLEFIDYRNEVRGDYKANEVRFYGQKEDKIIDARILDCSVRANCYFDRAYFLDNDTFVISEISRTIDKKDQTTPPCSTAEDCEYSFKVHFIDLKKNKRWVYQSNPFVVTLSEVLPEL